MKRLSLARLSVAAGLAVAAAMTALPGDAEAFCQGGCWGDSGVGNCGGIVCGMYSESAGCSTYINTIFSCAPTLPGGPLFNPPVTNPGTTGGGGPGTSTPPRTESQRKCDAAVAAVTRSREASFLAAKFAKANGLQPSEVRQSFQADAVKCAQSGPEDCVYVKITTYDDLGHMHVATTQVCPQKEKYDKCVAAIPAGLPAADLDARKAACMSRTLARSCLLPEDNKGPDDWSTLLLATCQRPDGDCGADCETAPTVSLPPIVATPAECYATPPAGLGNGFLSTPPGAGGPSANPPPGCAPATEPTPRVEPALYLAMGDSYASGENVPPYGALSSNWLCHRSVHAYGGYLAYSMGYTNEQIERGTASTAGTVLAWGERGAYAMSACSGDTANEFIGVQMVGVYDELKDPANAKQVKQYEKWRRKNRFVQGEWLRQAVSNIDGKAGEIVTPDLITLSVGGNDIGFGQIVGKCIAEDCTAADLDLDARVPKYKGFGLHDPDPPQNVEDVPTTCKHLRTDDPTRFDYSDTDGDPSRCPTETIRNKIRRVVGTSISMVLSRAPNAWVVVIGYPGILPKTHPNPNAPRINIPEDLDSVSAIMLTNGVRLRNYPTACPEGITPAELDAINAFLRNLNAEIHLVVEHFRAMKDKNGVPLYPNLMHFDRSTGGVPIENLYEGHSICDAQPYGKGIDGLAKWLKRLDTGGWVLDGAIFGTSGGQQVLDTLIGLKDLIAGKASSSEYVQGKMDEPFHPNVYGHNKLAEELVPYLVQQNILEFDDRKLYAQPGGGSMFSRVYPTRMKTKYRRAKPVGTQIAGIVGPGDALVPRVVSAPASTATASLAHGAYGVSRLTPNGIASLFGTRLAAATEAASGPECRVVLGGTRVNVIGAGGLARPACLLYASPTQINFVTPEGTWDWRDSQWGTVTNIQVVSDAGPVLAETDTVTYGVAPGLFTTNMRGTGQVAGRLARVRDGVSTDEAIESGIDMGPATDQLGLVLYGTGITGGVEPRNVSVTVGGVPASIGYVGRDPRSPGLDRLVVTLPRNLALRRGEIDVRVRVNEPRAANVLESNTVTINIIGGEADGSTGGGGGGGGCSGGSMSMSRAENCELGPNMQ